MSAVYKRPEAAVVDVELRYPVRFGNETVDSIGIRRAVGADVRALAARGDREPMLAVERLTGAASALVDLIDQDDLERISLEIQALRIPGLRARAEWLRVQLAELEAELAEVGDDEDADPLARGRRTGRTSRPS